MGHVSITQSWVINLTAKPSSLGSLRYPLTTTRLPFKFASWARVWINVKYQLLAGVCWYNIGIRFGNWYIDHSYIFGKCSTMHNKTLIDASMKSCMPEAHYCYLIYSAFICPWFPSSARPRCVCIIFQISYLNLLITKNYCMCSQTGSLLLDAWLAMWGASSQRKIDEEMKMHLRWHFYKIPNVWTSAIVTLMIFGDDVTIANKLTAMYCSSEFKM